MGYGYSKYNQGPIIPLETIPKEELAQAMEDFSDGSEGLKACLGMMWSHHLKTQACASGREDSFEEAYILMDSGADLFSYLSDDVIQNETVALSCDKENRQCITIVGPLLNKNFIFFRLAKDIASGKKQNGALLQKKVGKELPMEWRVHGMVYHMLKDCIPQAGPLRRVRIRTLMKELNVGSLEQQNRIIGDCYRELSYFHQNDNLDVQRLER